MTYAGAADLAAWFVAGLAVGIVNFGMLRRNADLYARGRVLVSAGLHVARLGTVGLVLVLAVRHGAAPLLACAVGVVLARIALVRRLGRLA